MVKPVHLSNGRKWPTRKDATKHFKEMLARYRDGQMISDAADHSDLSALLERYDSDLSSGALTKTGAGTSYFSRERNEGDGWSTSGFHVHRVDGTSTDFSFYSAIQAEEKK
jgi:hypothetical protein